MLGTERLVLRQVAVTDVDNFMALNRDEGVMRFLDRQPPEREAVAAEIRDIIEAYQQYPGLGRYAAEDLSGDFVGWFGLRVPAVGSDEAELRAFHGDFPDPLPGTEHGEVVYEITLATWRTRSTQ